MAQQLSSDSDDDFHSLSQQDAASPTAHQELTADADAEQGQDSDSIIDMLPPVHPIPSFQHAFEESIVEAAVGESSSSPDADPDLDDAEMRRRKLLEAESYAHVRVTRWKQRPDAKYHPFLKLMAQIVFGMHLLQQEQAKSNEAVVKILQNHVNDVDDFLQRTSDDFDLAITDIEERIRYLQLPMQHMDIFEVMLDEKKFRADLLHGNEKIEQIIVRTSEAMKDAMLDIESGLKCIRELDGYLTTVEKNGPIDNKDIVEVFSAMRGNQQGWTKFLSTLQTKGANLGNELVALGNVAAQIARLAGVASRRNKPSMQSRMPAAVPQPTSRSTSVHSKFTKGYTVYQKPGAWLDKPLPKEPSRSDNTVDLAMAKPHPVPYTTRFEQPRERAPAPRSASSPISRGPAPQRPRTSGSLEPRSMRHESATRKPDFQSDHRKHSNPLRSHPPDQSVPANHRPSSSRQPGHASSKSAGNALKMVTVGSLPLARRSKSSGNVAVPMSATPSSPTSRKTVGFEQRSGSTRINLVPERDTKTEAMPSTRTGFSRRLSAKLKQSKTVLIPIGPPSQTDRKLTDSAYSSDRKRSTSSPTNFTSDTENTESLEGPIATDPEKKPIPTPDPEKTSIQALDPEKETEHHKFRLGRDGSRLALFPKVSEPLPKTASPQVVEAWGAAFNENVPAKRKTHAAKASRSFNMSKFFHRRTDSRSVTA